MTGSVRLASNNPESSEEHARCKHGRVSVISNLSTHAVAVIMLSLVVQPNCISQVSLCNRNLLRTPSSCVRSIAYSSPELSVMRRVTGSMAKDLGD